MRGGPGSAGLLVKIEDHVALRRALLPLRHRDRAVCLRAVVREDEAAGRAGACRRRCDRDSIRFIPERWTRTLSRLDGEHPRLVHLAPDSGGATGSRSGTAMPAARPSVAESDPDAVPDCGSVPTGAGRGRARYLVPSCALAVLDAGLAGQDAGTGLFLSDRRCWSPARDIIFFWVARMIMMACEFMGDVPFSDVLIHGTGARRHGRKMSKSLGNVMDPLEVIDNFGADTLRFTLLTGNTPGRRCAFSRNGWRSPGTSPIRSGMPPALP